GRRGRCPSRVAGARCERLRTVITIALSPKAGRTPGWPERGTRGSVCPSPSPPAPLPSEQRTFSCEAGAEADHEPPFAVERRLVPERLLEHEEDRRGGHVAVATQHRARVCHLGLAQLEEHSRAIDHATSRRVEHPVADVLALESLRRQEGLRHLA